MKAYFKRLRSHPGVEPAIVINILCVVAGTLNKSMTTAMGGALFGGVVGGIVVWSIVLVSNIKRKD